MPDILLAGNEVSTEICLPEFGPCDPSLQPPPPPGGGGGGGGGGGDGGNPFFINCDDVWNANLCSPVECWRMPFDSGDGGSTYNGDDINYQSNLISGYEISNVQLTDLSGNLINNTVTLGTRDGGGQTINISEVAAADGGCFKLNNIQLGGNNTCFGWDYEPITGCDTKTVKISGLYKDGERDCYGFVYPHDNSIRLYGYIVEGKRSSISKTIFGKQVKKRRVETFYTLYINDLIPPIIHHVLTKQILAANQVKVQYEGKTYILETEDNFTLASESTGNRMIYYGESGITLRLICEVPGKC